MSTTTPARRSRSPHRCEDASIVIEGDAIEIAHLRYRDRVTADAINHAVAAGAQAEAVVQEMLRTGARALAAAGGAAVTERARAEFEAAALGVSQELAARTAAVTDRLVVEVDRLLDPAGGELARLLERQSEAVQTAIHGAFNEASAGAVQHRISRQLTEALATNRRELLGHLASQDPTNPLAEFKTGIARLLSDLATQQAAAAADIREDITVVRTCLAEMRGGEAATEEARRQLSKLPANGLRFEGHVLDQLAALAAVTGDEAQDVSLVVGASGRKCGDCVIGLDAQTRSVADGRIVVEAKTERLSRRKAIQVLDDALTARDADYAILAVSTDAAIKDWPDLTEVAGNKLIVVLTGTPEDADALRVAYRYARLRTRLTRAQSRGVDATAVGNAVEAAAITLASASTIKRALESAGRGVESAREALTALTERLDSDLRRISTLITAE